MSQRSSKAIAEFIMRNVPRDLMLGVEDALNTGAMRGYASAKGMNKGHVKNAVGQMRHFHMNEAFNDALVAGNANPTPIRGNGLVVGRSGVIALSRFNISAGVWNNARRNITRRHLAEANRAIEQFIQPALFDAQPVSQASLFFVAAFSGSMEIQPDTPQVIYVAVPDKEMKSWIFQEPLERFCSRYFEIENPLQPDTAKPKLKPGVAAKNRKDQS
ncbi:hypothetical protein [Pseudomonas aeruginosa]|uniref:hypothetical protein n=1 Tax=Pseudomonas aeruginosa TaxID=287 RepID=UPI0018DB73B2|nr:hypothetical protein [Pseudomonas aeruginosa]MBH8239763.1 hypothetical protein [Pseudomonas aeruginosa]